MNESAFRKGTKRLSNIAKNQEFLKRRTFLEEKDNVIILRLQLDQDQVIEFKFIAFEIGWLDLRTQSTFNKEKFVYITAENITHLISYGYYKDTYFSTLRILKNLNKKLRLSLSNSISMLSLLKNYIDQDLVQEFALPALCHNKLALNFINSMNDYTELGTGDLQYNISPFSIREKI